MNKFNFKPYSENFYVKKYNDLGREEFNLENTYSVTDKLGLGRNSFATDESLGVWLDTFLLEKDPTTIYTDKYCEGYFLIGPKQHHQYIPRDLYDCLSSFQDIQYFAPYLLINGVDLYNPNSYMIKDTQLHYGDRENKIQECIRFYACYADTDKVAHILTILPLPKYPVLKDSVEYEYVRKNTNKKYMNDISKTSTSTHTDIDICDLDIPAGVAKILKVGIPEKFLSGINEVKYLNYFTNDVTANLKRKASILQETNYVEVFDNYRVCHISDYIYDIHGKLERVDPIYIIVYPFK